MDAFFSARVARYDEHMIANVEGCREGYARMAALIPQGCEALRDLGCGTGPEPDEIFKRFPALAVTGIDLTAAMPERLREAGFSTVTKIFEMGGTVMLVAQK